MTPNPPDTPRRPWARTAAVVVYLALYLVLGLLFAPLAMELLLATLGTDLTGAPPASLVTRPVGLPVWGASLATVLALTWLFARGIRPLRVPRIGLAPPGPWLGHLALGFGLGALLMALIAAGLVGLGAYRVAGVGGDPAALAVAAAVFAIAAIAEETVFRGYVQQSLGIAWGVVPGISAAAFTFGAFHVANYLGAAAATVTAAEILVATLGIVVAGFLLAVAYVVGRGLWLPIGLHWAWNLFQGPVFGFPVSGLELGGLIRLEPAGPAYLTGGSAGPEASVVGIAVEIVGILLLWWLAIRGAAGRPAAAPAAERRSP